MTFLTTALEPVDTRGLFSSLSAQQPDSLLGLIKLYANDPRPNKLDLGVGVYRDASGATPVLQSVKAAEAEILAVQGTKSYLGSDGDPRFTDLLASVVFGDIIAASDRLTGVQTPGGTGALRLAAELIFRSRPESTIWIGTPTWPNHGPIFREAGLDVRMHRFSDPATSRLDFDGMMTSLAETRPGDVLLLHGCCHNPTGEGFSADQWRELTALVLRTALTPLIDLAYQGLGDGLEEDALGLRYIMDRVPEALVAYSCDKNFGLYRERVGALWTKVARVSDVAVVRDNTLALTRSLWSMPPDHGAAIVRTILDNSDMRQTWEAELGEMRIRLNDLRGVLAEELPSLSYIGRQRGMFAVLPLTCDAVLKLRETAGIYMADSGRINLAGLRRSTIPAFAKAIAVFLDPHIPS